MTVFTKIAISTSIAVGTLIGANHDLLSADKSKEVKPIEMKNFDNNIKPGADFFRYSNGGWLKSNPIPDEYSRWGAFNILQEENNEQMKTLMNDAVKNPGKKGSEAQKIGDFYSAAMDSAKIEKEGIAPLKPYLDKINKIKTFDDVMAVTAEFQTFGMAPIFAFYASQDDKNSKMIISCLAQAGLGMGNRDYYTEEDDRSKELRMRYVEHLGNMFNLLDKTSKSQEIAKSVFQLESKLAKTSMTLLEQRDPQATYNALDIKKLQELCPAINWATYFKSLGINKTSKINVTSTKFFTGISEIIKNTPIDVWKDYLRWNLMTNAADYLSANFVNENFNFFGKVLSGSKTIQPRWKRALSSTNGALGEAVGKVYCEKYFPAEAKTRMLKLVANLRAAFDEHIQKLTWMTDGTKVKAREKLAAMNVKIGYPDKWKDYSKLTISKDKSYFENAMAANKFDFADMVSKVDKPTDPKEWHMTPQTVNAYYSPNSNEIVFPAAILQPPFFFLNGDDAINYGGIGGVIGHEMTHGFDDQGKQYDKEGNLNNWWTDEDTKRFEAKAQVLIDQFNKFEINGDKVNGELTIGENIADLGGITLAHTALLKALAGQKVEKIDGFTPEQRLLLSWSQVWRSNIREAEQKRRLKDDVHSPAEARVNGLMPNLPFFQSAFDIKPGEALYRPEAERAVIW